MKTTLIKGIIIEDTSPLTFDELCHAVGLKDHVVIEMIEQHLIEPQGNSPQNWAFDSFALKRAKIAANFHRDLEINWAGIGLALDLLEKIERLEARLRLLEKLEKN